MNATQKARLTELLTSYGTTGSTPDCDTITISKDGTVHYPVKNAGLNGYDALAGLDLPVPGASKTPPSEGNKRPVDAAGQPTDPISTFFRNIGEPYGVAMSGRPGVAAEEMHRLYSMVVAASPDVPAPLAQSFRHSVTLYLAEAAKWIEAPHLAGKAVADYLMDQIIDPTLMR